MTVTVNLPPDLESTLRRQAERSGQAIGDFVLDAVKEKIAKARAFQDLCAPFAQAIEAAGVSDQEFQDFFDGVREEVWRDKQGQTP
ncbi:MAG TPA: hypothetical protein VNH11_14370 [Pirellulales bacterium]|nr:hypothetical protein [Pirellulales bacterium]